jgi:hypothetical protein
MLMNHFRTLVAVIGVLTVAGCGAHPAAKRVQGVIQVQSGVSGSSLRQAVLGIRPGTSAAVVRKKLGDPFAKVSSLGQSCWAYHASQPGTALDALDFCIDRSGKVARILTGMHLSPAVP